jgi:predicted PurR-regulated permease PerM
LERINKINAMKILVLNPEYLYYATIILIVLFIWMFIRTIIKRIANFTENSGKSTESLEEIKEQLKILNSKIESLENKMNQTS